MDDQTFFDWAGTLTPSTHRPSGCYPADYHEIFELSPFPWAAPVFSVTVFEGAYASPYAPWARRDCVVGFCATPPVLPQVEFDWD